MEHNPYVPSTASLKGASTQDRQGFRDLSRISRSLSILLCLGAAASVCDIIAVLMPPGGGTYTTQGPGDALPAALAALAVGLVQLLLFIITAIVFLRWTYLAHKNLPELGARHLAYSPGWAVASFFVPLIQLWVPFQAMRDLAKASRSPVRWDLEDTPPVIVAWWALWVIGLLLDYISVREAPVGRPVTTEVALLDDIFSVALYLVARLIIWRIWRDQAQHARLLQPASAA